MYKLWLLVLGISGIGLMINATPRSISVAKVLCESTDPKNFKFNHCLAQKNAKNKTGAYISITHSILPNLLVSLRLHRQSNKNYSPFLYDTVINFCDFMRNPTTMFWGTMYKLVLPYTNINHTCPYEEDFIVAGFAFEEKDYKLIPVPRGNYMIQVKLGNGLTFQGTVCIYCTVL